MEKALSRYEENALRLIGLSERELAAWLSEFIGYGFDGFFGGALSEEYPSDALLDMFSIADKFPDTSKDVHRFRHRVDAQIARLAVEYGPPFAVPHGPRTLRELFVLIERAKLSKAAAPVIRMMTNGKLKGVGADQYENDLHFHALHAIGSFYPIVSMWQRRQMLNCLLSDLQDARYSLIAFRSVCDIQGDRAWKHVPQLVRTQLSTEQPILSVQLADLVECAGIRGLQQQWDFIYRDLRDAAEQFAHEHIVRSSGNTLIDRPFKLLLASLHKTRQLVFWDSPTPEFDLESGNVAEEERDKWAYCFSLAESDSSQTVFCTSRQIEPADAISAQLYVDDQTQGRPLRSSLLQDVFPCGAPNYSVVGYMNSLRPAHDRKPR